MPLSESLSTAGKSSTEGTDKWHLKLPEKTNKLREIDDKTQPQQLTLSVFKRLK